MPSATNYPPLWENDADRPGSRMPRKFTMMSWLQHPTLVRVYARFDKEVPGEYWAEDIEAAKTTAIVSCPCGQEPHVPLHTTEFCPGCDRVYLNLGDTLRVARNPDVEPEEKTGEEPAG